MDAGTASGLESTTEYISSKYSGYNGFYERYRRMPGIDPEAIHQVYVGIALEQFEVEYICSCTPE